MTAEQPSSATPNANPDNAKLDKIKLAPAPLDEHEDYYIENGYSVFTAAFHLKRGFCCGNGCRHCPYPIGKK